MKIIKNKYSKGGAVGAGASLAAPAVKKHYHWEPAEGNLVKAKPLPKDFAAAWKKVAEYNDEYTLCPDRPGAGTQARFAGEQKVAWQRQKGKDENENIDLPLENISTLCVPTDCHACIWSISVCRPCNIYF